MSEEEAKWIKSEYRDCPLYAAVDRFAKDVAGIEGMPAEHPSFLFYNTVYAIDDIKCIGNKERRLEKCRDLKNDVLYYLKHNKYYNQNKLAAEIIYCVRYSLEALSLMGCLKEIRIMSEHTNELISDDKTNEEIREIARKCFMGEKLVEWIKSYYDGTNFISETIKLKVKEMRKANPPKEEQIHKPGGGNRNKDLFPDEITKQKKIEVFKNLFSEKKLNMTDVMITNNSKEYKCIIDFYSALLKNGEIEQYANPRGYIRFLNEAGITFAAGEKNAENKFRKIMNKLLGNMV